MCRLPLVNPDAQSDVWATRGSLPYLLREDSPNPLFYLDPPYLHETRTVTAAYQKEMTDDDHKRLLLTLETVGGKFILSGYRNALYDEFADRNGWRRVDREIDNKASSAKEKPIKTESLWMNFSPDEPAR